MSFKIAVLAVALLACQGNAQLVGGFIRPFISGYANGISEMAKPFIQFGQSVAAPASEYFGSMRPGMSQYFYYPSKPFAAAQSAVQEAQAAAQLAAQQAQLAAQSAVEQAQAAAKQAQAAAMEGYGVVSSNVPSIPGASVVQVIRPRPLVPQVIPVPQVRPRPYPMPMPMPQPAPSSAESESESESESRESDETYVPSSLLPEQVPADLPAEVPADLPAEVPADLPAEVPADLPAEVPADLPAEVPADLPARAPADIPMTLEARAEYEIPNLLPSVQGPQ